MQFQGRSPGHPEHDVPFLLHIGQGTMTQPAEFRNNGRERSAHLHGGGENLRFCDKFYRRNFETLFGARAVRAAHAQQSRLAAAPSITA
jgi:hypothetical protein